jgi:hypothetical protein
MMNELKLKQPIISFQNCRSSRELAPDDDWLVFYNPEPALPKSAKRSLSRPLKPELDGYYYDTLGPMLKPPKPLLELEVV